MAGKCLNILTLWRGNMLNLAAQNQNQKICNLQKKGNNNDTIQQGQPAMGKRGDTVIA